MAVWEIAPRAGLSVKIEYAKKIDLTPLTHWIFPKTYGFLASHYLLQIGIS